MTNFEEIKKQKQEATVLLNNLRKLKQDIKNIKGDTKFHITMDFVDEDLAIVEKILDRVVRTLKCECIEEYLANN